MFEVEKRSWQCSRQFYFMNSDLLQFKVIFYSGYLELSSI